MSDAQSERERALVMEALVMGQTVRLGGACLEDDKARTAWDAGASALALPTAPVEASRDERAEMRCTLPLNHDGRHMHDPSQPAGSECKARLGDDRTEEKRARARAMIQRDPVTALANIVSALSEPDEAEIRALAIEECARVCDEMRDKYPSGDYHTAATILGLRLRALTAPHQPRGAVSEASEDAKSEAIKDAAWRMYRATDVDYDARERREAREALHAALTLPTILRSAPRTPVMEGPGGGESRTLDLMRRLDEHVAAGGVDPLSDPKLLAALRTPPPRTEPSAPSAEGRDALIVKVTREATRRRSVKWRDVKGEAAIVAAVLSEVDALCSAHSNAPRAITAPSFASPITKLDDTGREVAEPCSPAPEPSAPSEANLREWVEKMGDAFDDAEVRHAYSCRSKGHPNGDEWVARSLSGIISRIGPPPSAPSPDDELRRAIVDTVMRQYEAGHHTGISGVYHEASALYKALISTARRTASAKDGAE
jgi:hypothetical protein